MLADNMALKHSRESSTDREPKKLTSHWKQDQRDDTEMNQTAGG